MNDNSRTLLLAVDVGNSRFKFGLFQPLRRDEPQPVLPAFVESLAAALNEPVPWDELAAWAQREPGAPLRAVVAGANPPAIELLLRDWPRTPWPKPVVVLGPATLPIAIHVDAPEKVGIDRLLNAVAANALRSAGEPMIVVDAGTATTVDYVSPAGAFEGGAILPGLQLSARALHRYTALLPLIPQAELAGPPPAPVGRNTRDALRSGLLWGQVGSVRELIARLSEIAPTPPTVLLTGGGALLLAPFLKTACRLEPHLGLRGLALTAALGLVDRGDTRHA